MQPPPPAPNSLSVQLEVILSSERQLKNPKLLKTEHPGVMSLSSSQLCFPSAREKQLMMCVSAGLKPVSRCTFKQFLLYFELKII